MGKKLSASKQATALLAFLLLMVNVCLGFALRTQTMSSMQRMTDERMLDVSGCAAALLDGDILKTLTKEDEGSRAYRSQADLLSVFMDNTELEYIYCINNDGDGTFSLSIDPSPDPGVFGEDVVRTGALVMASRGIQAVDEKPYEDRWGRFYSAYSPVYDSNGEVAAIVAVDFAAWRYEQIIASQNRVILLSSLGSLMIGLLVMFVITGRIRRSFKALYRETDELATDVEELTKEIRLPEYMVPGEEQDPFREPESSDDSLKVLHDRIQTTETELRDYIAYSKALAYTDALTGCGNRTAYLERIRTLEESGASDYGVLLFDLNSLKSMNDRYGHEYGDRMIIRSALLIRQAGRSERVYRIGGDEFVVILEETDKEQVNGFLMRFDGLLEAFLHDENQDLPDELSLSRGWAIAGDGEAYRDVFNRADEAMYTDKKSYYMGRGDRRGVHTKRTLRDHPGESGDAR